jgi:predicted RNase H-like nuclease
VAFSDHVTVTTSAKTSGDPGVWEHVEVRVVGVDACRQGWVGVLLTDGRFAGAVVAVTLTELIDSMPDVRVVGVDMPLGLVDQGWRDADDAAAAVLGPRRSSLFRVPPGPVWEELDFAAANARCRELTGAGMSAQAWGLRSKLREANQLRRRWPGLLREVHPEVSFRHLAGAPLPYAKSSWNGQALRRALLRDHGIELPDDLAAAGRTAPDDVLDAAVAAWSAHRVATGSAVSYPDPPQRTGSREEIAIWA